MAAAPEFQHTLAKSAGFSGTSLHTGEKVSLKLHPASADHGIKFKRKDLADEPTIDAKIENLKMVERATTIGEGSIRVHTVEHVLSALSAMGVEILATSPDWNSYVALTKSAYRNAVLRVLILLPAALTRTGRWPVSHSIKSTR